MASASRASRPMRASMTWRGTLPLRNPGTRTSRDSRLAVRSIAGRSSSGSTTTLIRTLVGSTGSRVLRTGASGWERVNRARRSEKTATRTPTDVPGPGHNTPGALTDRRPVYPRPPPGPGLRTPGRRTPGAADAEGLWMTPRAHCWGRLRSPTGGPGTGRGGCGVPGRARVEVPAWTPTGRPRPGSGSTGPTLRPGCGPRSRPGWAGGWSRRSPSRPGSPQAWRPGCAWPTVAGRSSRRSGPSRTPTVRASTARRPGSWPRCPARRLPRGCCGPSTRAVGWPWRSRTSTASIPASPGKPTSLVGSWPCSPTWPAPSPRLRPGCGGSATAFRRPSRAGAAWPRPTPTRPASSPPSTPGRSATWTGWPSWRPAGRGPPRLAAPPDRLALTVPGRWRRGRPNFSSRGAGPSAPVASSRSPSNHPVLTNRSRSGGGPGSAEQDGPADPDQGGARVIVDLEQAVVGLAQAVDGHQGVDLDGARRVDPQPGAGPVDRPAQVDRAQQLHRPGVALVGEDRQPGVLVGGRRVDPEVAPVLEPDRGPAAGARRRVAVAGQVDGDPAADHVAVGPDSEPGRPGEAGEVGDHVDSWLQVQGGVRLHLDAGVHPGLEGGGCAGPDDLGRVPPQGRRGQVVRAGQVFERVDRRRPAELGRRQELP